MLKQLPRVEKVKELGEKTSRNWYQNGLRTEPKNVHCIFRSFGKSISGKRTGEGVGKFQDSEGKINIKECAISPPNDPV